MRGYRVHTLALQAPSRPLARLRRVADHSLPSTRLTLPSTRRTPQQIGSLVRLAAAR